VFGVLLSVASTAVDSQLSIHRYQSTPVESTSVESAAANQLSIQL
jgi:hypothetical protein